MKVTPLDRLTFLVTSESMPDVSYMVDLGEGVGERQCADAIFRRKKKLKATCKHVEASKRYLLNEVIEALRKQEKC